MEGWSRLEERLLLVVLALVLTLPGVGGSQAEAEAAAAAQPLHRADAGATLQPYQVEVAERQSQEAGADPPRRSREEAAAEVGPTCMLLYVLCYVPDFSAPINSRYNITDQQTVRNSQAKV